MATINEIARLCNVSRTTVSRVLNNQPYVSKEKREQILHVINQLDYTPSGLARNFRAKKNYIIAISIPRIDHPFFAQLIKGAVSFNALEKNYKVLIFQTFYNKKIELKVLDLLKKKEIDGVILCSLENKWGLIEPYLKEGPILLCNEYHDSAPIPIIGYDEFDASYKAVKYLIEKGHRKIGFCYDLSYSQAQKERKAGYLKALSDYDLPYTDEWFFGEAFNIEDGLRIFEELLNVKEKPTALYTGNDQVAAGVIKKAILSGYKVPDDLAVIGYDNQLICEVTTPTITTIEIPIIELGQQVVLELLKHIEEDVELKREVMKLPTKLIIREST